MLQEPRGTKIGNKKMEKMTMKNHLKFVTVSTTLRETPWNYVFFWILHPILLGKQVSAYFQKTKYCSYQTRDSWKNRLFCAKKIFNAKKNPFQANNLFLMNRVTILSQCSHKCTVHTEHALKIKSGFEIWIFFGRV